MSKRHQLESPDPRKNSILAKLDPGDYKSLMRLANVVMLDFRKCLYLQDGPVDSIYFPLTCMVSLLVSTKDQPKMEMAVVGWEGVVGATEAIHGQGAITMNLIQIPGAAVEVKTRVFLKEIVSHPGIKALVQRHQHSLTRQVLQGAACNRLHSMEERCARWLLMTRDRAGQDNFPLTQEFLAHMLGVRRATVNGATGMLKKAGLIRFVRGHLTILDRPGLESASCDCYQAVIKAHNSVMHDGPGLTD